MGWIWLQQGIYLVFVLFFPLDNGKFLVMPHFFIPRDTIYTRVMKDKVPYNEWEKLGLLNITSGDIQDYEAIRIKINELRRKIQYQIGCI